MADPNHRILTIGMSGRPAPITGEHKALNVPVDPVEATDKKEESETLEEERPASDEPLN